MRPSELTFLLLAAGFYVAGYLSYWLGLKRLTFQPNRWSWLIWSGTTVVEALTYGALNGFDLQAVIFAISAACCVMVTFGIWSRSSWKVPSLTEWICVTASACALALWGVFQLAFWAHLLVVAVVPLGFAPTWISAWRDRRREASPAWALWTLGDFATSIVILLRLSDALHELPYILVELACHAVVWAMIGWRSIASFRPMRLGGN